ncbi:MAG TPA: hypothetical protein VE442_08435 [Jatrophihabitans sp.]|jgi:hypothetical protein|nr:hypothetical protein [Jatrophihabitans sp.]
MAPIMVGFVLLLFPFLLLGFVMIMGRVEEPIARLDDEREIEHFLDEAQRDELELFVREGTTPALRRFHLRLGLGRLRRGWRRAA